jgi:hypothetical protein
MLTRAGVTSSSPEAPLPGQAVRLGPLKEGEPAVIRRSTGKWLTFDQIDLPADGRPTNAEKVGELVKSIRLLGLQSTPIVVERNGRFTLVTGRHRLEALRVIGEERVPVRVVDFDDVEARMWTISENLHRNELTALQRADQIAEWVKLSGEKSGHAGPVEAQVAQKPQVGLDAQPKRKRAPAKSKSEEAAVLKLYLEALGVGKMPAEAKPEAVQVAHPEKRYEQRGDSLASRDLGLSRDEVRRARAIAALPGEVKARAADLGLADNQSALLEAARAPTRAAQISTLEQRADRAAAPLPPRPASLRNLENIAASELARWIKQTTPNDRPRVTRTLRDCADILEDEMRAAADRESSRAAPMELFS